MVSRKRGLPFDKIAMVKRVFPGAVVVQALGRPASRRRRDSSWGRKRAEPEHLSEVEDGTED